MLNRPNFWGLRPQYIERVNLFGNNDQITSEPGELKFGAIHGIARSKDTIRVAVNGLKIMKNFLVDKQ